MKTKMYKISDSCIACKNCMQNCPKLAISFNEEKFRYEIDQSLCIKCGLCKRKCVYNAIDKVVGND